MNDPSSHRRTQHIAIAYHLYIRNRLHFVNKKLLEDYLKLPEHVEKANAWRGSKSFARVGPLRPGKTRSEAAASVPASIHQLMIAMDEVHNAHTSLTFDALKRVSPLCIVELTATPDTSPRTGSNVLVRVSASELKAEPMIKLPIVLTVHENSWESAIGDAHKSQLRRPRPIRPADIEPSDPEVIQRFDRYSRNTVFDCDDILPINSGNG